MIGKPLGHYQISSQLGKGGMGEVYQAKDQVLGRDVAIKVLPDEFARDADRVARFQREAKLLASLNHPNIATIHGLEESGGKQFLVMELVEGDTLADRIKCGPIPVEESLKLALQIAEALEAAHEKGVIHRDLKPANIKVTPDGKVKVLDFGLAKAFAGDQGAPNLSNSPTLSDMATMQGVILGTAAYMSPEQARGKSADKRTDIWAFGCVFYEMLTGRQTWIGSTATDILAAALAKDPDFTLLPSGIPPDIRKLINRCLQKDPLERLRDVGDARVEIKQLLSDPGGGLVLPEETVMFRGKLRIVLACVAAAIILSAITGAMVWKWRTPAPLQVIRLACDPPEGQKFTNLNLPALAVSGDGKKIAFVTDKGLFLRFIDDLDLKLISNSDDIPSNPFFSPDGQWIGYWSVAENRLKKIALSGGTPVILCDTGSGGAIGGVSWGTDNKILLGAMDRGIMRVSSEGGIPDKLIGKPGETHFHPRLLPDGKSVLFTLGTDQGYKIAVQSTNTAETKVLFAGDCAWYLPTGHLVYALDNNLFAVPFDLDDLAVTGESVVVVQGVYRSGSIMAPQYAISEAGSIVYMPGAAQTSSGVGKSTLVWVNREGKEEALSAPANNYISPKISPDGTRIALAIQNETDTNIWMWNLDRRILTRLTFERGEDWFPIWTPDGKRIAFLSSRDGRFAVNWKTADGTGKAEPLLKSSSQRAVLTIPSSWSADGKSLLLEANSGRYADIGMVLMNGDRKWEPLLQENYGEVQPQISPDGQWMAYTSDESGQSEIYVRPFPELDKGRYQISPGGGNSPLWSPSGRELFYRNSDAAMAVPVSTNPNFSAGTPKVLFRGTYSYAVGITSSGFNMTEIFSRITWDISPHDERFLMMKRTGEAVSSDMGPRKIHIVLNWFEELKQRVPTK